MLGPAALEDDVHAGLERLARGLLRGGRGVVQDGGAAGGGGVGDDEPLEAPRPPERLSQELRILGGREAADGVVGGHDRARPGGERRAEGREVQLGEGAVVEGNRIAVTPAVADVGHEVLRRGDDAEPFERGHKGTGHRRGEERILAVGLLGASPADVGGEVHDRGEHLADAAGARLAGDGGGHPAHEGGVPGGGEGDGLGKDGGAGAGEAVDRLVERDDRDAEAGALHEEALDGVDPLGVFPRGGRGGDLQAEDAVAVVVRGVGQVAGDHEQLPELLLDGHPLEGGPAPGRRPCRGAAPRERGEVRTRIRPMSGGAAGRMGGPSRT